MARHEVEILDSKNIIVNPQTLPIGTIFIVNDPPSGAVTTSTCQDGRYGIIIPSSTGNKNVEGIMLDTGGYLYSKKVQPVPNKFTLKLIVNN